MPKIKNWKKVKKSYYYKNIPQYRGNPLLKNIEVYRSEKLPITEIVISGLTKEGIEWSKKLGSLGKSIRKYTVNYFSSSSPKFIANTNNLQEAHKIAVEWMKKHPNG